MQNIQDLNNLALKPIQHKEQRVLTTRQLAEFYGVEAKIVTNNFSRNKERFFEDKHYFRLEGERLQLFLTTPQNDVSSERTKHLYLWTEHGALLHAKVLNSDKAWQVYETLIDTYFRVQEARQELPQTPTEALLMTVQALVKIERQVMNHEERLALVEKNAVPIRFTEAYQFTQHQVRVRQRTRFDEFVEERIGRVLESKVYFMTVFDEYKQYCKEKGADSLTKKAFSHLMRLRGYESDRNQKGIFYRNIILKIAPAESEQSL